MDAYDSDVLIYGASAAHPAGRVIRSTFATSIGESTIGMAGVGSVLLVTETLTKPAREGSERELDALARLIERLDLIECDRATIHSAFDLGVRYGLKTVDAVHLATAINAGAHRFITNNRRDFPKDIEEIDITYPEDLDAAPT